MPLLAVQATALGEIVLMRERLWLLAESNEIGRDEYFFRSRLLTAAAHFDIENMTDTRVLVGVAEGTPCASEDNGASISVVTHDYVFSLLPFEHCRKALEVWPYGWSESNYYLDRYLDRYPPWSDRPIVVFSDLSGMLVEDYFQIHMEG